MASVSAGMCPLEGCCSWLGTVQSLRTCCCFGKSAHARTLFTGTPPMSRPASQSTLNPKFICIISTLYTVVSSAKAQICPKWQHVTRGPTICSYLSIIPSLFCKLDISTQSLSYPLQLITARKEQLYRVTIYVPPALDGAGYGFRVI